MCEVLIVHTSEAQEWAHYLQSLLLSSEQLIEQPVRLLALEDTQGTDADALRFGARMVVVLLLSAGLHGDPALLWLCEDILTTAHRVVVLFCGVCETEVPTELLQRLHRYPTLYPDDEPQVYVSTVLNCLTDGNELERQAESAEKFHHVEDEEKQQVQDGHQQDGHQQDGHQQDGHQQDGHQQDGHQDQQQDDDDEHILHVKQHDHHQEDACVCLSIQPERIVCGTKVTLYILLKQKLQVPVDTSVQFSCGECVKLVEGNVENEYTVSVNSPDMPPGTVCVSLYCNGLCICSMLVTYCTAMGEMSHYLQSATDPLHFMCQALNISSSSTEILDTFLADLLKSRMPATGLDIFGMKHLVDENMSVCHSCEEIPTLLHFAARFGLRKLVSLLLECPGARKAYTLANRHGDCPNHLAERSGHTHLSSFMKDYMEMPETQRWRECEAETQQEDEAVYESMSNAHVTAQSAAESECVNDVYESMLKLNPDSILDTYDNFQKVLQDPLNSEEDKLRSFFQRESLSVSTELCPTDWTLEDELDQEDPYKLCSTDQIYDTVDELKIRRTPEVLNRPPAPVPRPSAPSREKETYICRVFADKQGTQSELQHSGRQEGLWPHTATHKSNYCSYTCVPGDDVRSSGQQQLILLQERVKAGNVSVDEALREFKEWQQNQERRAQSLRFQQENLRKLRDSITRRQREKVRSGKDQDLEISAPLQQLQMECVYETTPTGLEATAPSNDSNRTTTSTAWACSSEAVANSVDSVCVLSPVSMAPPPIPPRLPERPSESYSRYTPCPSRSQKPNTADTTSQMW